MSCRIFLVLPLATLTLAGCDKPTAADPARPGSPAPSGPYFNVRSQLDSLVRALDARHAGVLKEVSLRNSPPETARVAQVKWADELQLFYQADINKAALRGAYTIETGRDSGGPGSLARYVYTVKPNYPNAQVRYLNVVVAGHRLYELTATVEQQNALFSGRKTMRLRLSGAGSDSSTYEVSGQQKLILFDTVQFHTKAKVL